MDRPSDFSNDDAPDLCAWWLRQAGAPLHRFTALRPDFLIISPPKTGSTWLAANLRRHPQLFVPTVKELKYFSTFFRSLNIGWYLDHFEPAAGRLKGEASPCYALLPVQRIRLIRLLMPDVKLIFLMRAPADRAWSHAKHNHRFGEANFASPLTPLESVSDDEWQANFLHDWPLASGDYLGQLRRWLAVFPSRQMYVGFYESIARDPTALLRDVFAFLNVRRDVDLTAFPITDRILPGPAKELSPGLGRFLHRLLHGRTVELEGFLKERFHLETPPEWRTARAPAGDLVSPALPAFCRDLDDDYLSGVLDQEHTFRSGCRSIEEDYLGYRIVFYRGRLYAFARFSCRLDPEEVGEVELKRLQNEGECFIASTMAEIKERLTRRVNEQSRARQKSLEANLLTTYERLSQLEGKLGETVNALRRLEGEALRLSPTECAVVQIFRSGSRRTFHMWRRLLASLAAWRCFQWTRRRPVAWTTPRNGRP
jgi:hypothetical protein